MPRILQNTVFVCLFAAIAILASTRPAYACSASGEPPTIETTVHAADIVVVAQVIGSDVLFSDRAALLVEKYLKGSGPDILFAEGYGSGAGDCRNPIFPWQIGIFFLDGDPGHGEFVTASYEYPYYAVFGVSDDSVAKIAQLTGQQSPPIPAPFDIRVRAFGMFFTWVLTVIVMFVLPLIVAICFLIVIGKVVLFVLRRIVRCMKSLTSQSASL